MASSTGILLLLLTALSMSSMASHTQNASTEIVHPEQVNSAVTISQFVASHNAARRVVGVPPLIWDTKLARYARVYASQRHHDCLLVHSPGYVTADGQISINMPMVRTSSGVKAGGGQQLMWWPHGLQRSNITTTIQTHVAGLTALTTPRLFGETPKVWVRKDQVRHWWYICSTWVLSTRELRRSTTLRSKALDIHDQGPRDVTTVHMKVYTKYYHLTTKCFD